jgi:alkylhydroperoxidase family enzyme
VAHVPHRDPAEVQPFGPRPGARDHAHRGAERGGVRVPGASAVRTGRRRERRSRGLRAGDTTIFDERERAALAYAEASTRTIRVPDDVFVAVRRNFDDREIVELTATIGAYNLVSRFLEALQVDHE